MSQNPDLDTLAAQAPAPDAPLSELQEWMAQLLRHQRGLQKNAAMVEATKAHFSGNDRLSPAEQINLYRKQFWLRHTSILIDDFPGVSGLLGQKEWERVAESYLTQDGFDVFALRNIGSKLPEHLRTMPDLERRQLLIDMARLEWAYEDCFDQVDDPPLSLEKVQSLPTEAWAHACMKISSSVRLLQISYPVAHIRRQIKKESFDSDELIEEQPQNLVVYRRDYQLYDKQISLTAFLLLQEFQKGTPLVPACEKVVAQHPASEGVLDTELMNYFALWGRLGWIVDVIID